MDTSRSEVLCFDLRVLAAKAIKNLVQEAVVSAPNEQEKAERFRECIRSLEMEKAKMEAFKKELPMSVHLIGDVIGWLKDEMELRRRLTREMFAPTPVRWKVEDKAGVVTKVELDANDKMDWMSSAQLWSCGNHSDTSNNGIKGRGIKKPSQKMPNALHGSSTLATASEKVENENAALPVPDLSLSSPAIDSARHYTPNGNGRAIDQARAQGQPTVQRKARRCWSPELHRQFLTVLQHLGGEQVATPKQIRELMKVDGLTRSRATCRLHTRRAAGQDQQAIGLCSQQEQQSSTLQSGLPEVHLQLSGSSQSQPCSPEVRLQPSGSSRAVSVTAGDSYEGEEEEEDKRSESCSVETQHMTRS